MDTITTLPGDSDTQSDIPQVEMHELDIQGVVFNDKGNSDFLVAVDLTGYAPERLAGVRREIEMIEGIERVLLDYSGFPVALADDCDHSEVLRKLRDYVDSPKYALAHATLSQAPCICGDGHNAPFTAELRLDTKLSDDEQRKLGVKLGQAAGIDEVSGRDDTLVLKFSPVYAGHGNRAKRAMLSAAHRAGIQVEVTKIVTAQQAGEALRDDLTPELSGPELALLMMAGLLTDSSGPFGGRGF